MTYPSPSSINGSLGLPNFLDYINTVTNYWFSNMFLIGIWIITVIGISKANEDIPASLAVGSFVTFIVALLMWAGGVVSPIALGTTIAITLITMLILYLSR